MPRSIDAAPRVNGASESSFYSNYEWALNPVLTVRELFGHLREELERYETLAAAWQREESKANLSVFMGAITCTVDDYLGASAPNFSRVAKRFPTLRIPVLTAQKLLDSVYFFRSVSEKSRVAAWRENWIPAADAISNFLVSAGEPPVEVWRRCRAIVEERLNAHFPQELLDRPMQLPSGYRSQDLAHQDAAALGDLFAATQVNRREHLLIVGPRSMGAYFAPVLKARLRQLGWKSISWCTIRPKKGISPWERRYLRALDSADTKVLVIDESPSTGNTFLLLIRLLRELGVQPERLFLLAAMHPTQPDWKLPENDETCRGVTLIRLGAHELHRDRLLEVDAVRPLLAEYFSAAGWNEVEALQSAETQALNAKLDEHFQDGFQCRLKRVFDVRAKDGGEQRVFAKSVGWGWLGYHGYFAGTRLAGFVAHTFGLRNGLLFTEWLDAEPRIESAESAAPPGELMAKYIATRARELRLAKDPIFEIDRAYGWTGWSVLDEVLRKAYGPFNRLKVAALHKHLVGCVTSRPALTDGQMKPEDWIRTLNGFRKIDFDHHNFGRTELYVVDPAYDIAMAAFEFGLAEERDGERHELGDLVRAYVESTRDANVEDRILLWTLVYGRVVVGQAIAGMAREKREVAQQYWHQRFYKVRNWLVYEMNRFSGSLLPHVATPKWGGPLFATDLDGVFDTGTFGFAHTTASGLMALAELQAHEYAVILNTARGVTDVRQYCKAYRLPGGIAESGAIFVDAVNQREIMLIEPDAAEQLARCREMLQSTPGVFVDPNYEHTIRAYPANNSSQGYPEAAVRLLLGRPEFDRLTFIPTDVDTTVLAKGGGKGPALQIVKKRLGISTERVAAVGDNDQDVEMLRIAELAYAPANASKSVRDLAAAGHCILTKRPEQRGLLEAARKVIHQDGRKCEKCDVELVRAKGFGEVMQTLLEVCERTKLEQLMALLDSERL
jgi:hydroxymethylpyrimidine pyrophosphatase-like HAD family hydrolase